jgi:hypothetical protein
MCLQLAVFGAPGNARGKPGEPAAMLPLRLAEKRVEWGGKYGQVRHEAIAAEDV